MKFGWRKWGLGAAACGLVLSSVWATPAELLGKVGTSGEVVVYVDVARLVSSRWAREAMTQQQLPDPTVNGQKIKLSELLAEGLMVGSLQDQEKCCVLLRLTRSKTELLEQLGKLPSEKVGAFEVYKPAEGRFAFTFLTDQLLLGVPQNELAILQEWGKTGLSKELQAKVLSYAGEPTVVFVAEKLPASAAAESLAQPGLEQCSGVLYLKDAAGEDLRLELTADFAEPEQAMQLTMMGNTMLAMQLAGLLGSQPELMKDVQSAIQLTAEGRQARLKIESDAAKTRRIYDGVRALIQASQAQDTLPAVPAAE